jgi:hypothetical protein
LEEITETSGLDLELPAGQRVMLVGIRADNETPEIVSKKAIVVVNANTHLVVALPPDEVSPVASYLGSSDVFALSQPNEAVTQRSLQVVLSTEGGQLRPR